MATREIVELPDRKSGDINEIRDKKIALAKDAAAQSDLPQQLEYLIKNGQTGEFMNVLDSYINEKIRSALGGLIANLDKGAAGTTKAIACIDTNNDLGIINPANLASVLGAFINLGVVGWADLNNLENGLIIVGNGTNVPNASLGSSYIVATFKDSSFVLQIASIYSGNHLWYRIMWEGTWREWIQIK